MLESPFNSEYCEIFKSIYFEEHLRTAASKILFIRSFNSTLKNRLFEYQYQKQVKTFVFYHDWFLSHEVCIYIKYFFCVVEIFLLKEYVNVLWILTNEKHFPKTISQWEFDYGLFTNSRRIIIACNFSSSSFKVKWGILPFLTKYESLLENYLPYQAKFFPVN